VKVGHGESHGEWKRKWEERRNMVIPDWERVNRKAENR
jgi:hypothetical protein